MAYRIRRAPEGRRDLPRFYATADGKVHWTTFREVAQPLEEEAAINLVNRLRNSHGRMAHSLSLEPV